MRTRGVPGCTDAVAIAAAIGDDGTAERIPSGAGRRLPFKPRNGGCDERLSEDVVVELGGGIWNELLKLGVEGGSRDVPRARAV